MLLGQIIASSSLASSSYCWIPDHHPILFYWRVGGGGERGRGGGSTNFSDFSVTCKFLLFFFGDVQVEICVVPDLYTQTAFSLPYQLITKSFQKWSCQKLEIF
jgi:hypothetical protein